MRRGGRLAGVVFFALFALVSTAYPADRAKLFTRADSRTQFDLAQDIAKFIAAPADIKLDMVGASGPADTLLRLQRETAPNFAILPADAAHAYAFAASRGNAEAGQAIAPIRVIAPLYSEEIYLIVRGDSPYGALQDIRTARINIGAPRSSTALSASTLYRLLFDEPLAESQYSTLNHEDALVSLITDKKIDVVAIVGDQPAKILADMKPEARQYIKLLKFDAAHPSSERVLKVYSESTIFASHYRNLLSEDLPGISVTSYLVVHRPRLGEPDVRAANFARSWCQNGARLAAERHAKGQSSADRVIGLHDKWPYTSAAAFEPANCSTALPRSAALCPQEVRVLGLCE